MVGEYERAEVERGPRCDSDDGGQMNANANVSANEEMRMS